MTVHERPLRCIPLIVNRCLLAFALLLPVSLVADPLADVLARMDKSSRTFRGMAADLNDDNFAAPVNEHETHTGTVKFWRPKPNESRVLIEFKGPNAQAVSLEGTVARVYYPKANEVQVADRIGLNDFVERLKNRIGPFI